jgi:hypothetical protein
VGRIRLAVVLAVGAALVPVAPAMATGEVEVHDQADLTTNLRSCHVQLGLYSHDQVLTSGIAVALPPTFSRVRTTTMGYCSQLAGVENSTHTTHAVTSEYLVEGVPRAVMTQDCANDPGFSSYCSTDQDYSTGLQGVHYGAAATFVIRLPMGEEFTSVPPQCTVTAVSGRAVKCDLTTSLVTHDAISA